MFKLATVLARQAPPAAADPAQAKRGFERWRDALAAARQVASHEVSCCVPIDRAAEMLLTAVFGNSGYLTLLAEQEPEFVLDLLADGPEPAFRAVIDGLVASRVGSSVSRNPASELRRAKRRVALITAVADIANAWTLDQVTAALSDFADVALDRALAYLIAEASSRGVIDAGAADDDLVRRCGLFVLGVGKLGGRELNYSSDIDIIVLYDPERFRTASAEMQQREAIRLTRGLIRLIADRTADGYVYRTDLRLRPDPGSTPVAMSILAAEEYYETLGQNWERAALIKARPVAGDLQAGAAFLKWLVPFIWRKHLDFAAIQDIHSIKRQINAHRGGGRITIAGHNIKLGRGGIREIEFFVQTQQLIWGGRLTGVRSTTTIGALHALARAGKIGSGVAEELSRAYCFLRRLEHRLQMIDDAQTHVLPVDPQKLAAVSTFLGYQDVTIFKAELLQTLRRVESDYAELFEDAPALTVPDGIGGNLVFTGGDADPDTLATLERLGFGNVQTVDAAVRGWHHGRCRAMRSTRARELLTELMPHLLTALAEKPDPDAAFLAFDRFLNGLPAGVQLFSMFHANPPLLGLVTDILGVAPALADHLARRPSVLESVLSAPDFFEAPPSFADLEKELCGWLDQARDAEDILDFSRRWANDRRFQVGVQALKGLLDTTQAAAAWTRVAQVALACLLPHIEAEFAAVHGRIAGCAMAIVGMGKLGGSEMTATSDLDLIFVYAEAEPGTVSDGKRPLPVPQYYARLSQRLINAINAPTSEGRLYEVDMRLRPSGKAGPIAVSVGSFARYQRDDAWVWEQMALTRARVVAGPAPLAAEIETIIHAVLTRPRDVGELVVEVALMRSRMAEEHRAQSLWDVKHVRGGMVDIEFIAQFLQLKHAHQFPDVLSQNTRDALVRLQRAGIVETDVARELVEALELLQAVQHRIRLNIGETIDASGGTDAPKALRLAVAGLDGLDFDQVVRKIETAIEVVHGHFIHLVQEPAEAMLAMQSVTQGGDNEKEAAPDEHQHRRRGAGVLRRDG